MLTATLLVLMERSFRRYMLMEDAPIVRVKTTKRNVRYRIVTPPKGSSDAAVEDSVVEEVRCLDARMSRGQRGVVFCRTTAQCEQVAEKIGCSYHHSGKSMIDAQRKAARERWANGESESRWIVAMTGLGTGIDLRGLVAVIHLEDPYGLVDYA